MLTDRPYEASLKVVLHEAAAIRASSRGAEATARKAFFRCTVFGHDAKT